MTEDEATRLILAESERDGFLYQEAAANHLFQLQDENLTYFDKPSNLCDVKGVEKIFNDFTPKAVYRRSGKF